MNFNNLDSNNPNISHFFQYNLQEIEDLNLEIANLIKLQAKEYKNHLIILNLVGNVFQS